MEYEFKKRMNKKEMVGFLRELADSIEKGEMVEVPGKGKVSIKSPVFVVDYEFREKDYGKKLEIDIKMKDYG